MLAALLFLLASARGVCGDRVSPWPLPPLAGFVFTSELFAPPSCGLDSPSSLASLRALAATGATTVRLVVTALASSPASTSLHGVAAGGWGSATATPAAAAPWLAEAARLNLSVIISAHLDLDWSLPANAAVKAPYSPSPQSRRDIGASFDDGDWAAFFAAYSTHVLQWAAVAARAAAPGAGAACSLGARGGVSALSLGDGLAHVFVQDARMRALIAAVRAAFGGCLTLIAAGDILPTLGLWDALDFIGHEAFWPLGAAQPLGAPLSSSAMAAGWAEAIAMLAAASAANGGKRVALLSTGAQSRPNCHVSPWDTGAPAPVAGTRSADGNNQGDPSAWPCSYDMLCQANFYQSIIDAFSPQPWWAGATFFRWAADEGAGGPSDTGWTPHGKAAESTVRAWTGAAGGDGAAVVAEALRAGAAVLAAEEERASPAASARRRAHGTFSTFTGRRGFVIGGPDEWSSPYYRLDSAGALASLENMVSLGANSAEVVIQWYTADVNDSSSLYPIVDPASVMRTTTDDELRRFAAHAAAQNVTLALSPMIDPDWTLPSQLGCRTGWPEPPGCHWRGEIGYGWPKIAGDCSGDALWMAWHEAYRAYILHYAVLAQELGMAYFILAHELQTPTQNCAAQWSALISSVRSVYDGKLLAAVEGDALSAGPAQLAWMRSLDLTGFECYLGSTAPPPTSNALWEDAPLADLRAGVAAQLPQLANFSRALGGLDIMCTEVGWMAAPWASEIGWGQVTDLSSSDVVALDVNGASQALAYEAFITELEAQPWFAGAWFWLWRADPTAGGLSDNSPVPWAKQSAVAISQLWRGALTESSRKQ